jgi:protein-disulfide isomerase
MRRPLTLWLSVALLAAVSLGASCNDDDGGDVSEITPNGTESSGGEQIEELSQVDVSDLTRSEQRVWRDLVNDLLSPCGEPVSVARCVQEERECRRCVPAARYVVRLVTEGLDKAEIEDFYRMRFGRDGEVEVPVDGAPVRGAPMAPITIVEFSDFECPYCGLTAPILERVLSEHEGRVKLIFLHYPLDGHEHAQPAARAAIAAENQGKFWEMHDMLFENQRALETENLEAYAEELGLDMDRFRADFTSDATQRRIEANRALGRDLDLTGTPTIFVNGRRFPEGPRSLPAYIQEELDQ